MNRNEKKASSKSCSSSSVENSKDPQLPLVNGDAVSEAGTLTGCAASLEARRLFKIYGNCVEEESSNAWSVHANPNLSSSGDVTSETMSVHPVLTAVPPLFLSIALQTNS